MLQALRKTVATTSGQFKYGIEVYITDGTYGVDLAEYLVAKRQARLSEERLQVRVRLVRVRRVRFVCMLRARLGYVMAAHVLELLQTRKLVCVRIYSYA